MFWLAWYTKPCLGWEHPSPSAGPLGWKGFCQQAVVSVQAGGTGQADGARRAAPDGQEPHKHALQASFADERRIPCPGTFFRERPPPSDTFLFPPGLHRSGTAYAVFGTFQKWVEKFLSFLCSALSCGNFSLVSAGELSQQREKEKTSEHRAASTLEKAFETFSFSVYIRE